MGRKDLQAKIRLTGDSSGAERAIKRTDKSFGKFSSGLKTKLLGVTAAIASLAGGIKLLEAAGKRLGQRRSLQRSLEADGKSIDTFLGQLDQLANKQISTSNLILASNRALALGIDSDDIPGLLEAATKASVALGISATQAFDDITTGVGRASPLILDNLGIVVDAVKVYAAFADEIGVSTEALTKQQKTAALTAAVIENAGKGTEAFADAQSRVTVALAQSTAGLKTWFENVVDGIAKNAALATTIDDTATAMSDYAAATRGAIDALVELAQTESIDLAKKKQFNEALKFTQFNYILAFEGIRKYGQGVKESEAITESQRLGLIEAEEAYTRAREGVEGMTQAQIAYNEAQKEAEARSKRIAAGLLKESTAMDKLAAALGLVTEAELEKQLADIAIALEEARIATGGASDQFIAYAEAAKEATEKIEERLVSVRGGFGDLEDVVDKAKESVTEFGQTSDSAGSQVGHLEQALDDARISTDDLRAGLRSTTSELVAAGAQAILTASQFDALRKAAGDAAAVTAALQGGGTLSQGGTRIRLAGGGSRLTNTTGRTGTSNYGLSPFGTGGRYDVDENGNLRPQ
jgi:hypothetical protein